MERTVIYQLAACSLMCTFLPPSNSKEQVQEQHVPHPPPPLMAIMEMTHNPVYGSSSAPPPPAYMEHTNFGGNRGRKSVAVGSLYDYVQ